MSIPDKTFDQTATQEKKILATKHEMLEFPNRSGAATQICGDCNPRFITSRDEWSYIVTRTNCPVVLLRIRFRPFVIRQHIGDIQ